MWQVITSHKIKGEHQGQILDIGANIFKMPILKKIKLLKRVKRKASIGNLYNQVSHLTQETIWVSDKNTRTHNTQYIKEVNPFLADDHKAKREDKSE